MEENSYKKRLKYELKNILIILGVGIIYAVWCSFSKIRIPCVFHLITGLKCPGCGMTSAAVSMTHFDFKGAYESNVLAFSVVPVLCFIMLIQEIRYIKTGERTTKIWEAVCFTVMLIVSVLYAILRNI